MEVYKIVKAISKEKVKKNAYAPNSTVLGKSSESNTRVKQLKERTFQPSSLSTEGSSLQKSVTLSRFWKQTSSAGSKND